MTLERDIKQGLDNLSPEFIEENVISELLKNNKGEDVFLIEVPYGLSIDIGVSVKKIEHIAKKSIITTELSYEIYGDKTEETKELVEFVLKKNSIKEKFTDIIKSIGKGTFLFRMIIIGPGIKTNIYNLKEHKALLYDIINIESNFVYDFSKVIDFCILLDILPINSLKVGNLYTYRLPHSLDELQDDVRNIKSPFNKSIAVNAIRIRGMSNNKIKFTIF